MSDELEAKVLQDKIRQYESFVQDRLKPDLQFALVQRDEEHLRLENYKQLKSQILVMKEKKLTSLETQMDLSCNFYVDAKIPDTSMVFVNVGLGFFIELTQDEALKVIDEKEKEINRKIDIWTHKASKVNARINLVLGGIQELMNLSPNVQ